MTEGAGGERNAERVSCCPTALGGHSRGKAAELRAAELRAAAPSRAEERERLNQGRVPGAAETKAGSWKPRGHGCVGGSDPVGRAEEA